jgi:hypothetical protein
MILENGLYRLEARRGERWIEAIGRGLADALRNRSPT